MRKEPDAARRSERSRQAILTAAGELCQENGYGRMTIEGIAARAGVGKMTIYRWWPSKGAIVLDLLDRSAPASTEPPDTGDLAADLHVMLTEIIELLTPVHTKPGPGLIAEGLHDPALAVQLRDRLIVPRIAPFEERLRKAQAAGQLPPEVDFAVALDLLYGPLYHRLVYHFDMPGPEELDTLIAHVLRALRAPE